MNLTFEKTKAGHVRTKIAERSKRITVCPECKDVQYKNFWYAPDSRFALLLDNKKDTFTFHTCPACEMQHAGLFEGVLYIKDIPKKLQQTVVSVVLTVAKHDYDENPQHRIVELSEIIDGYKVTTTSAVMAARIGEKIQSLFGACSLHSVYQCDPHPVQVTKVVFVPSV